MDFLSQCTSGGCGAKIGPNELAGFLACLPSFSDQQLLVGFDSSDDAAIYQVSEEMALISTVDFFSPMVDDPKTFGRIAAANAMSDIYAMGGDVLFALNLVCFPEKLPKKVLSEILYGGAEKLKEANASLAGGHSIYDHEPKYGLSVTGKINPKRIIHNNTAQVGDILILTKALGVGLVQAAMRVNIASSKAEQVAVKSMERLNKYAATNMRKFSVHACTDITGFGLLVHASEMADTKVTIIIDTDQLPILPEAEYYAEEFLATAAGQRNRQFMTNKIDLSRVKPAMQEILFDPQTSGGLLISVSPKEAEACLNAIRKEDPVATIIGEVCERIEKQPLIIL